MQISKSGSRQQSCISVSADHSFCEAFVGRTGPVFLDEAILYLPLFPGRGGVSRSRRLPKFENVVKFLNIVQLGERDSSGRGREYIEAKRTPFEKSSIIINLRSKLHITLGKLWGEFSRKHIPGVTVLTPS